jgi:hypothetical protein
MWRLTAYLADVGMPNWEAYEDPRALVQEFSGGTDEADAREALESLFENGYTLVYGGVEYFYPPASILYTKLEEV